MRLILASTSTYRSELLARLGLAFETRAPRVDEEIRAGEPPADAAARLALAKAEAIENEGALVIGADQVASCGARILRKPGGHAAALAQLEACQGKTVSFHTAVVLVDQTSGRTWRTVDLTEVEFARLDRAALDRYLERERPYDCAGGFKAEGLGIALFAAVRSSDPTGLIGLPLIFLAAALREAGLDPLGPAASGLAASRG